MTLSPTDLLTQPGSHPSISADVVALVVVVVVVVVVSSSARVNKASRRLRRVARLARQLQVIFGFRLNFLKKEESRFLYRTLTSLTSFL